MGSDQSNLDEAHASSRLGQVRADMVISQFSQALQLCDAHLDGAQATSYTLHTRGVQFELATWLVSNASLLGVYDFSLYIVICTAQAV